MEHRISNQWAEWAKEELSKWERDVAEAGIDLDTVDSLTYHNKVVLMRITDKGTLLSDGAVELLEVLVREQFGFTIQDILSTP